MVQERYIPIADNLHEWIEVLECINKNPSSSLSLLSLESFYQKASMTIRHRKRKERNASKKELEKLAKHANEILKLIEKQECKRALYNYSFSIGFKKHKESEYDFEIRQNISLPSIILSLHQIENAAQNELKITETPKKRGRASLENYYEFVKECAIYFENESGNKFTCLRHKDDQGNYAPITDGHRFVYKLTEFLNRDLLKTLDTIKAFNKQRFTHKNVYNACEKVVTEINKKVVSINSYLVD